MELADTGLVDTGGGIAAERGRGALGARGASGDALAGDLGAGTELVTLAEAGLASESRPGETTVVTEATNIEIGEVETSRLLVGTLVVGVAGAGEGGSSNELDI